MFETSKICLDCKVLKHTSKYNTRHRVRKSGIKLVFFNTCKQCKYKREIAQRANPEIRARRNAQRRAIYQRRKLGVKIQRKPRQTYVEKLRLKAEYRRKRRQTDHAFKILCRLRGRLYSALKGKRKSATTKALLGCSVDECRKYIEAQFLEGMNWENTHIDHIVPCASFNLEDPEQQRRCFHFTNLQPLIARDNIYKGSKITEKAAQREWVEGRWVCRNTLDIV